MQGEGFLSGFCLTALSVRDVSLRVHLPSSKRFRIKVGMWKDAASPRSAGNLLRATPPLHPPPAQPITLRIYVRAKEEGEEDGCWWGLHLLKGKSDADDLFWPQQEDLTLPARFCPQIRGRFSDGFYGA